MRILLRGEIAPPTWPEGSSVRGFHASDGPRLHALLEHGYRNGGGSVEPYDVWLPAITGDSEFDSETCFLVEVGDELAAASICWTSAFVKDLVVSPSHRRLGLASSLLQHAFATFVARGAEAVELKVEAGNHAAIALYRSLGMAPAA